MTLLPVSSFFSGGLSRLLLAGGLLLSAGACSPTSDSKDPVAVATFENERQIENLDITNKQKKDAAYLVKIVADGLLTQQLSTLALQKAASPATRTFAQNALDQHIKIDGQVKELAQRKGLSLPDAMGNDRQEQYKKMDALTGAAFDKQYADAMVDLHDTDASTSEDVSQNGHDGDIRGFAAKYQPVFQQHLQDAKQVQETVKGL